MVRLIGGLALTFVIASCAAGGGKPDATAPPATPSAAETLSAIATAAEAYELERFYALSGGFLERHAEHPSADEVRYRYALQLVTENLGSPGSDQAGVARGLLKTQVEVAKTEARRFEAALLHMKFAPEGEAVAEARAMLARFAEHAHLDQVYFWLINDSEVRGDLKAAAEDARALLRAFPNVADPDRYRRIIRRSGLIGRRLPLQDKLQKRLAGSVVIVDFWATWCAPCIEELPRLRAFWQRHRGRGFEVVGISLDDSEEVYQAFIEREKLEWPMVRGGSGSDGLAASLGVHQIPTWFLLDRSGRVVATELESDAVYARAAALLSAK